MRPYCRVYYCLLHCFVGLVGHLVFGEENEEGILQSRLHRLSSKWVTLGAGANCRRRITQFFLEAESESDGRQPAAAVHRV